LPAIVVCQAPAMLPVPPSSRASPLLQGDWCRPRGSNSPAIPVGAGLPAKKPAHPASPLPDTPPSPASRLLQCFVAFTNPEATEDPCGSWLASDSGVSGAGDVAWAAVIAGKPAPTGDWCRPRGSNSPAIPVGAGLPAKRPAHPASLLPDTPPSPASRLLQCFVAFINPEATDDPCGSWLASDSGVSGAGDVACAAFFAGKPAPTGGWCRPRGSSSPAIPVGAGLPAIAVCQAPAMLPGPPSSRASPLPQGIGVGREAQAHP